MAVLLEYGLSGGGLKTDDSIISSSCSNNETNEELFCFHLNYDGTFDLASREFYDNVSSTSTPSAVRSAELQQKHDYDTDDSGFGESLVSDSDLLQMSNLHLGDESHCENLTNSDRSVTFPLPKLCLLSQFDEFCESEVKSTADASYERCETAKKEAEVDAVPSERLSVRRQRSPDAAVERCCRHRLSLDAFSESRSEDSQPIRRSSDSFVPPHSANQLSVDLPPPTLDDPPHHIQPSPTLDDRLETNLPSAAPDEVLQSSLSFRQVAGEPGSHIPAVTSVLHKKPPHDNKVPVLVPSPTADRVFSPSPHADRVLDPSPVTDIDVVIKEGLQRILAAFAPPCLDQLIGRKMGLDHVDIISELFDRSMSLIIRHICSYLTDTDLPRSLTTLFCDNNAF